MGELLKEVLLKEDKLGLLQQRNGEIIPNPFLQMKFSKYAENVISSFLNENSDVVDLWLQKLHAEYTKNRDDCKFEDKITACFHLGIYEIFEMNFERWIKGKSIKIVIGKNKEISLRNNPIHTVKTI